MHSFVVWHNKMTSQSISMYCEVKGSVECGEKTMHFRLQISVHLSVIRCVLSQWQCVCVWVGVGVHTITCVHVSSSGEAIIYTFTHYPPLCVFVCEWVCMRACVRACVQMCIILILYRKQVYLCLLQKKNKCVYDTHYPPLMCAYMSVLVCGCGGWVGCTSEIDQI